MPISVLDIFSIGIGPSSSHTVGPMRAARDFARRLDSSQKVEEVSELGVELYGSLALTGLGHGTHHSVLMGLEDCAPDSIDPAYLRTRSLEIEQTRRLKLLGRRAVPFEIGVHLRFLKGQELAGHSNGLRLLAFDPSGRELLQAVYYSIGGGFVVDGEGRPVDAPPAPRREIPYPFKTARELLEHCSRETCAIKDIMLRNECVLRSAKEVHTRLLSMWFTMRTCIDLGLQTEGPLPALGMQRRAPGLYATMQNEIGAGGGALDWRALDRLSIYAIAVAGGRIVTAPTNGSAGIIPAVLRYYVDHVPGANGQRIIDFLLTAGAIGILFKEGASLSGAEVGCQGEIGTACSMAAGALTAVLGGTGNQIENAAEIAMEHSLGLTCDPVGGYVQIPCIERNALGAVKAVAAARLALLERGAHVVPLDNVIAAMKRTGADMSSKYKETSLGGLAAALPKPAC
jgi:L-serine dehydratase